MTSVVRHSVAEHKDARLLTHVKLATGLRISMYTRF